MTARYRVDDVARIAGTTVRNVRSYQEKGILHPPAREGRVAYYDDTHVARLRTIASLLERGYSLDNIGELLASWEQGKDLGDALGLEEAITRTFAEEEPVEVTLEELLERFPQGDFSLLERAMKAGLVKLGSDGWVSVASIGELDAGAELAREGVPIERLFDELASLQQGVDRIAQRLVAVIVEEIVTPRLAENPGPEQTRNLGTLVTRIRPLAKRIVDAELARALDRHVRTALGDEIARASATPAGRFPAR